MKFPKEGKLMPSLNLLAIFNPSNYWRGGYVTVGWNAIAQQFQIPPEQLVLSDLRDLSHTPLLSQVDRIDPEDPSRDTLVFYLPKTIPPASEDEVLASGFVRIDQGNPIPPSLGEPFLEVDYGADGQERGVKLVNSRLIVYFNLIAAPEDKQRNWFAGAATSVELDHVDILDPLQREKGKSSKQDPEKRCMQVAGIVLPGPPHPDTPFHQVSLYDCSYRLVSYSRGAVRASITIASEPFEYVGADAYTGINRHLLCQLYRVISLYAGADYLIEEIFVKGKAIGEDKLIENPMTVNPNFGLHYFAHMNMGHTKDIQQTFPIPDWYAVSSTEHPYAAYGLAADVNLDFVKHPHEGNKSRFYWQFLPNKSAKCLHLFMRGQPEGFDAWVSHSWYELIYKPLRAEVYQDSFAKPSQNPTTPVSPSSWFQPPKLALY
jgi:hypothetical protein